MYRNTLLIAAGLTCLSGAEAKSWKTSRPNVVLVFVDDLGYNDLSCFGSPDIRTPNLDRMAGNGMKLTSFYVSAPVSSASRAGLLTGKYNPKNGIRGVLTPTDEGLSTDHLTIAEVLREAGYATACYGKWHVGDLPGHLPVDRGFDEYLGIPYSNDMYIGREQKVSPHILLREGYTLEKLEEDRTPQGNMSNMEWKHLVKNKVPLFEGNEIIEYPCEQSSLTRRYFDRAIRFVDQAGERPFFLYITPAMPHIPLHASAGFQGTSKRGLYGDVVEEIDANFGRLVSHLEEKGLLSNTLILFTSDNGPWLAKGKDGGCAYPLRDGKFSSYEGGFREPFLAMWKGVIPAGTVSDNIYASIDILPTLAELAGQDVSGLDLDGRSFARVLNHPEKVYRDHYFYYDRTGMRGVRKGDWKYLVTGGGKNPQGNAPEELYNLKDDISEQHNVAASHPEIVKELRALMDSDNQDPLPVKEKVQPAAPELSFDEETYDFGKIAGDVRKVTHNFRFTNTGDGPLVIEEVLRGCGCTEVRYDAGPYAPGESGEIRITYQVAGRDGGAFSVPTEVRSNAVRFTFITVTGEVDRPLRAFQDHFLPEQAEPLPWVEPEAPQDEYELILQRACDQLHEVEDVTALDEEVRQYMREMRKDGTWSFLDYDCVYRTNWEPHLHLDRLRVMAIAYTCRESSLYGNPVLFLAIQQGMKSWLKADPVCNNWWYNQIDAPRSMADIALLMKWAPDRIGSRMMDEWIAWMEKGIASKWTGANKMDIAAHNLLRGCLLKNDSIVRTNYEQFFMPVCIAEKEGIKSDWSYQQHDAQLYLGGYGIVFVENVCKIAPLVKGTRYEMPADKVALFSDFVRKGFLNIFRGRYMDFSSCGRSITRVGTADMRWSAPLLRRMKVIDPEHADEYEDAYRRFVTGDPTTGRSEINTLFPLSDYMIHNRKGYDVSVRTVSDRTCRSERGNGENLYGTYMTEGVMNIRVDGDEYMDIFPVWEWDRIPGTTVPEGEVPSLNDWGRRGTSAFTGGASDGKYGVMAYDMRDYGMKARKGWFMFDDEIVCLGAGISSELDVPIQTAVNQCHLRGPVVESEGGRLIWHDKVGYWFPGDQEVELKKGMQSGRWSRINADEPGEMVTLPVFNLRLVHGKRPKEASYVYSIIPSETPEVLAGHDREAALVLANGPSLQAVTHTGLDIVQAIFYAPGQLTYSGRTLEVKEPCAVLVRGWHDDCPEIHAGDPAHSGKIEVGKNVFLH